MRRALLLVFLLVVLHLLLCGAYGARLGKVGMKSVDTQHTNLENNDDVKKDDDKSIVVQKEEVEVLCKDGDNHCASSKGKHRKLVTSSSMSTSTTKPIQIQENVENGANKDIDLTRGTKGQSVSSPVYSTPSPPKYEGLIDMTEDYSPAKRKPPIHN